MKTRDALRALSRGQVDYSHTINSPLLERSAEYLASYDETEQQILDKQAAELVQLPFLTSLRRKVAKLVNSPDQNLPIVTRFDLYTGIRKLAERSPKDVGLNRLASTLERGWHEDPLGTLTYKQVSGLVGHFKDQFPRSKAADAIEAECTRVGLHKLPVAKLARIASKIESQSDYDAAMEVHGFAGDRPEQIRARALVRGLVSLRGSEVASREVEQRDNRDIEQRVAERVDSLYKESQLLPPVDDDQSPGGPEEMPPALSPEMEDPILDMPAEPAEPMDGEVQPAELEEGLDVVEEIEEAADQIIQDAPPEAMDYIDHEMAEGHTAPPGTAEWGAEEILNEGHEAPPPTDEWLAEEIEELEADSSVGGAEMPLGPGPMEAKGPPGHEKQIKELKNQPGVDNPWAVAWSQHNQENPGAHGKKSEKGKSIPTPEQVKSQPEVTSYAPDYGKDGGKVLKAQDIEGKLLEGKTIKVGSVSISINSDNEVELWNKTAGRACDLINLDTAIADFMAMVNEEKRQRQANRISFTFHIAELVNVPCEVCGDINLFEKAASVQDDEYGCPCGHLISAGSVDELMKAAQYGKAFQIEVQYPVDPQNPQKTKMARDQILQTLRSMTRDQMQIHDEGKGYIISSTNSEYFDPEKAQKVLTSAGGQAEVKRVAQTRSRKKPSQLMEGEYVKGFDKSTRIINLFFKNNGKLWLIVADPAQMGAPLNLSDLNPGDAEEIDPVDADAMLPKLTFAGSGILPGAESNSSDLDSGNKQAQMGAPGGQPPPLGGAPKSAPPPSSGAPGVDASAPLDQIIQSAMAHYRNMGMAYLPAITQLRKDYKEREAEFDTPEAGQLAMQVGMQLWGGGGAPGAPVAPAPSAPAATPPPQPTGPGLMASKVAEGGMKTPSVRKPKDHISVPNDVGPDSETKGSVPTPGGSIKTQPNKTQHQKLSPKELGRDSEGEDLLPDPGKPSVTHDPKNQKGISLPNKKLDSDSEPNDPFPVPALGQVSSSKKE